MEEMISEYLLFGMSALTDETNFFLSPSQICARVFDVEM
jgi:hypothetical protein